MRLSAVDIESRQFVKKPRLSGYSVREIEEFRQEIVDNYEELLLENARLKEQLESLTRELERYRSIEQNLNESLVLAQRTAEEIRQAARQEAAAVVREAEAESREILRRARQDRIELEREIADLLHAREAFLLDFRALLSSYLQRVEEDLARLRAAEQRKVEAYSATQPDEQPAQPSAERAEQGAHGPSPAPEDEEQASAPPEQPAGEPPAEGHGERSAPPAWLRKTHAPAGEPG